MDREAAEGLSGDGLHWTPGFCVSGQGVSVYKANDACLKPGEPRASIAWWQPLASGTGPVPHPMLFVSEISVDLTN